MKGWVYVISNKSMPGLVKVGYSTKDPALRAEQLGHTGSPHSYLVEYELLIENPYQVEQMVHKLLFEKHEGKEWFRCTTEEAVAAIKEVSGDRFIAENYIRAERRKSEELYKQKIIQQEELLNRQKIERDVEKKLLDEELKIQSKYQKQFEEKFPKNSIFIFWILASLFIGIGITLLVPKISDTNTFLLAGLGGLILGTILKSYQEKRERLSYEYVSLLKQKSADLKSVRELIGLCENCGKQVSVDRAKLLSMQIAPICPLCKKFLVYKNQEESVERKNSSSAYVVHKAAKNSMGSWKRYTIVIVLALFSALLIKYLGVLIGGSLSFAILAWIAIDRSATVVRIAVPLSILILGFFIYYSTVTSPSYIAIKEISETHRSEPRQIEIEPLRERVSQPSQNQSLEEEPLVKNDLIQNANDSVDPDSSDSRNDSPQETGAEGDVNASTRAQFPVKYPPAALRAGITGTVVVQAIYDANGIVTDVSVYKSSSNRDLDRAAVAGVRKWKINPGKINGQNVGGSAFVTVDFTL